ncbi:hypothetical protein IP86_01970 [Rhodopseudomonas sp. AAP120]|uniref:antitoxin MazE-like protein n=1 Tax=Rhodopseudomonas sp. AAP120 TaxID=1523430 RepID=UPI0006B8A7DD|nr:antitoxin MazE-like protein [Rhodopseudomonas sp. AAP120]KPG01877.1 hypothetical protein IP86_01970 [Rhodopseudomonas sp. AAP120]
MPIDPDELGSQTAADPAATLKERLRAQGLRLLVRSVPDLRNPDVLADLRREAAMMALHPEDDALDDWIEQVTYWEAWRHS